MFAAEGPSIFGVAECMLRGEIAYRKAVVTKADTAAFDAAFDILKEAVALSEGLKYDEPWGWMVPVRHALGALLFEQGRVAEADRSITTTSSSGTTTCGGCSASRSASKIPKARGVNDAAWPISLI